MPAAGKREAVAGRRLAADRLEEARGGVRQQALDVVQDLALVGILEVGDVEEGDRRERGVKEEEQLHIDRRHELMRALAGHVDRAGDAAGDGREPAGRNRRAVELHDQAIADRERRQAQIERERAGERELQQLWRAEVEERGAVAKRIAAFDAERERGDHQGQDEAAASGARVHDKPPRVERSQAARHRITHATASRWQMPVSRPVAPAATGSGWRRARRRARRSGRR